jgi:hypothetical protein
VRCRGAKWSAGILACGSRASPCPHLERGWSAGIPARICNTAYWPFMEPIWRAGIPARMSAKNLYWQNMTREKT